MNKKLNELNEKEFKIGQVVYFTKNLNVSTPTQNYIQTIGWGIVDEIYSDGYALAMYELVDARMVDGIPIAEYEFNKKRKKLPKGWDYNTRLFEITTDPRWENVFKNIDGTIKDPENLKHLIDIGVLVRPSSQDKAMEVEEDINKDGWTIVSAHRYWKHNQSDYEVVPCHKLYGSYDEAKAVVDDYIAELNRQAELSDYDWSVEQIDKALDRWRNIHGASENECKAIREFLLKQDNIEDIDVRTTSAGFQWKYEKNKKWMTVEV